MLRAILLGLITFQITQTSFGSDEKWTGFVEQLNQQVRRSFQWRSIEEDKTQVLRTLRSGSYEQDFNGTENIANFVYEYCVRHSEQKPGSNFLANQTLHPCHKLKKGVLQAQPAQLRIYEEQILCHNCHEFNYYLIFDSGESSLPILVLIEFWDS